VAAQDVADRRSKDGRQTNPNQATLNDQRCTTLHHDAPSVLVARATTSPRARRSMRCASARRSFRHGPREPGASLPASEPGGYPRPLNINFTEVRTWHEMH
jgi:hypothetical protein